MKPKILVIGGLDPSGEAGVLRDVLTLQAENKTAAVWLTATTIQSNKKFYSSSVMSQKNFCRQWVVLKPLSQYSAIKIGMLGSGAVVHALVRILKKEKKLPPLVLDPVLNSSSGGSLLDAKGREALWEKLLPLVSVWTPNQAEMNYFHQGGRTQTTPLYRKGKAGKAWVEDVLITKSERMRLRYQTINKPSPRGTGCALASLIAAKLAEGYALKEACRKARRRFQFWYGIHSP